MIVLIKFFLKTNISGSMSDLEPNDYMQINLKDPVTGPYELYESRARINFFSSH